MFFCLLLIPASALADPAKRFFAPGGTGDGLSEGSPLNFTQDNVRNAINDAYYSTPINPEVDLILASGSYEVTPITLTSISANTSHLINAAVRLRISGTSETSGGTPIPTTLRLKDNLGGEGLEYDGFWKLEVINIQQIAHLEISDITIDCNFRGQASHSSASAIHPGAVSGLKVESETGRLCRVRVKNPGATGAVPEPYWLGAGTEAFPIWVSVRDWRRTPPSTQSHAWVIELCEVFDMDSVHRGYCTGIMVNANAPRKTGTGTSSYGGGLGHEIPDDDRLRMYGVGNPPVVPESAPRYWSQTSQFVADQDPLPLWNVSKGQRSAVVRRCRLQTMGPWSIALGTSTSSGITYEQNFVYGCSFGFNADTSPVHNIDLINNVFMDVATLGNVGGQCTDCFQSFNISGNLVRLFGTYTYGNYRNYTNDAASKPVQNGSLILGRAETWNPAFLLLDGKNHTLNNNWITTQPANLFSENPAARFFAFIRHTATRLPPPPGSTTPVIYVTLNKPSLALSGNKVSTKAWDFPSGAGNQDDVDTEAKRYIQQIIGDPAANGYWPARTDPQSPAPFTAGYTRDGKPGRLFPVVSSTQWIGAQEVSIAGPVLESGVVKIQARLIQHLTGASGSQGTPSFPTDRNLRFKIVRGPNANATFTVQDEIVAGSYTGKVLAQYTPNGEPGLDVVVAYVKGPFSAPTDDFNRDYDFWSCTEVVHSQAVSFVFQDPDVANDRVALVNGWFTLHRRAPSGNLPQSNVQLRFYTTADGTAVVRPATPTLDFTLRTDSGSIVPIDAAGQATVTLPATSGTSSQKVRFRITPVLDSLLEFEAAYVQILDRQTFPGFPTAAYGAGPRGEFVAASTGAPDAAGILLFDGPPWRVQGLVHSTVLAGTSSHYAGYATGVTGRNLDPGVPLPGDEHVVGRTSWAVPGYYGLQISSSAARWRLLPTLGEFLQLPSDLEPNDAITSDNGDTWIVGSRGNNPYLGRVAKIPQVAHEAFIPPIPIGLAAGRPSRVEAIVQDGSGGFYLFGVAKRNIGTTASPVYIDRPVQWHFYYTPWTSPAVQWDIPEDVGNVPGAFPYFPGTGSALAPNVTAGFWYSGTHVVPDGAANYSRAFRGQDLTALNPLESPLSFTLMVPLPVGGLAPASSAGFGVSRYGDVVGECDHFSGSAGAFVRRNLATVWRAKLNPAGQAFQPNQTPFTSIGSIQYSTGTRSRLLGVTPVYRRDSAGVLQLHPVTSEPIVLEHLAVGWGWTGTTAGTQRAALLRYQAAPSGDGVVWRGDASNGLMNLNDTSLVAGLSGWVLTSAEAVNDRGYIVGSGTYNSTATGFVLIPLTYP